MEGIRPENCAILAPTGRDISVISAALSDGVRTVPHKVIFDEARALLASRFAAFMLEPKARSDIQAYVVEALHLLANIERAAGTAGGRKTAEDYRRWASEYSNGKKFPKKGIAPSLVAMMIDIANLGFTGDPRIDWLRVKDALRKSQDVRLSRLAGHLDYLVAFGRGQFLASNLSNLWMETGTYVAARQAFDSGAPRKIAPAANLCESRL
jgi:ATP-dependent DNA helicase UvrD/PcrA